jgi:hypothetical protein
LSDLELWSNSSGPEKAELIKQVYTDGDSMGSISAKLSDMLGIEMTRSVIAGVYARNRHLLIDCRLGTSPPRIVRIAEAPQEVTPPPVTSDDYQEPLLIDLVKITKETCKWPIGQWPDIKFCGVYKELNEKPYCGHHTKLAYQPAKARTGAPFIMRRKALAAR